MEYEDDGDDEDDDDDDDNEDRFAAVALAALPAAAAATAAAAAVVGSPGFGVDVRRTPELCTSSIRRVKSSIAPPLPLGE